MRNNRGAVRRGALLQYALMLHIVTMKRGQRQFRKLWTTILMMVVALAAAPPAFTQPDPAATAAFDAYVGRIDARIDAQRRLPDHVLAPLPPQAEQQLRRGEPVIEQLTSADGPELPGALLHHWRGTAFIPGATAAEFGRLLRDFPAYPRVFAPQVTRTAVLSGSGDHMLVTMRVVQRHIITVVLDTTYDATFGQADARRGWSTSRSTQIAEIENAGTTRERALAPAQAHGFLWRLDSWWSYEERDGGLYIQIESVSLTRGIPVGLAWAVRPFVQSIPRDSLEFTLRAASQALRTNAEERSTR